MKFLRSNPLSWAHLLMLISRILFLTSSLARTPKVLTPNLKSLAVALALQPSTHFAEFQVQIAPPGTSPADDESRMNRSTYETVRTHRLYSVEGLQAAAAAAKAAGNKSIVDFESKSKEIKARWVHLADCDSNANYADRKDIIGVQSL